MIKAPSNIDDRDTTPVSNIEQQRAAFEAWINGFFDLRLAASGIYLSEETRLRWAVWEAAWQACEANKGHGVDRPAYAEPLVCWNKAITAEPVSK